MPWWSWVIVVYAGLFGLLTLTVASTCVALRLSSRRQRRLLVCEAERFLAGVTLGTATST